MINEIEEFKAYTEPVNYTSSGKRDTTYLGRFIFDTFLSFEGLTRVLTIIAKGYMFKNGESIETARRALCAWCSIPSSKKATPKKEWQYETEFKNLHNEFPELVNENGFGWFYSHVKSVARFIKNNPDKVNKSVYNKVDLLGSKFDTAWRKKVMQFQVPLFSPQTKGAWLINFDSILADAKVQGPLRNPDIKLPEEILQKIETIKPKEVPTKAISLLIKYYIANKQEDSDWVVLPVTNFDMYFGNTNFSKKWLKRIPKDNIIRDKQSFGICRYKVNDNIIKLFYL